MCAKTNPNEVLSNEGVAKVALYHQSLQVVAILALRVTVKCPTCVLSLWPLRIQLP